MTYTAEPLTIQRTSRENTAIVTIAGEIDLETASQLRQAALDALATRPRTLRLDLSGVTFMDSSGVHALLATRRRADLDGVRLVVAERSRIVDRLLDVAGVAGLYSPAAASHEGSAACEQRSKLRRRQCSDGKR